MAIQVVKPRIRGFICTNAHPMGCRKNVENQIHYIKENAALKQTNLNALIVGASGAYGLASRIALTWAYGTNTLGVFYERPPDAQRTATYGYYNIAAFHEFAQHDGFLAASLNGDAFSDELKRDTIGLIKQKMGKVNLLVYSVAAPKRIHPRTGAEHISILKPTGQPYTGRVIDLNHDLLTEVTLEPASEKEINDTLAVMGGEDLEFWVDALLAEDLLAQESTVVTYSYIGPEITWPMYRKGTIGRAKEDLEGRIDHLDKRLANRLGGHAYTSINKAISSQASMAIPVLPLYITLLDKVMNAKGINEEPIAQMGRLFTEHLGPGLTPTLDAQRFIRLDDREMRPDVNAEVMELWEKVNPDNSREFVNYEGLKRGFRNIFGFDVEGVNYDEAVETELPLP